MIARRTQKVRWACRSHRGTPWAELLNHAQKSGKPTARTTSGRIGFCVGFPTGALHCKVPFVSWNLTELRAVLQRLALETTAVGEWFAVSSFSKDGKRNTATRASRAGRQDRAVWS